MDASWPCFTVGTSKVYSGFCFAFGCTTGSSSDDDDGSPPSIQFCCCLVKWKIEEMKSQRQRRKQRPRKAKGPLPRPSFSASVMLISLRRACKNLVVLHVFSTCFAAPLQSRVYLGAGDAGAIFQHGQFVNVLWVVFPWYVGQCLNGLLAGYAMGENYWITKKHHTIEWTVSICFLLPWSHLVVSLFVPI